MLYAATTLLPCCSLGTYVYRCWDVLGQGILKLNCNIIKPIFFFQELMEEFPLSCVRDPVAVRDKNGMFNNITLFTVVDDPKQKHSPSDMHIFQIIDRSVSIASPSRSLLQSYILQKTGSFPESSAIFLLVLDILMLRQ